MAEEEDWMVKKKIGAVASSKDGRSRRYRSRLWGGFVADKLHYRDIDTGWGGFGSGDGLRRMPAIFTSRKAAREEYQDVRPIEVIPR